MTCYAIVEMNVHDDRWIAGYGPPVTALVEKHGGRYLARTPDIQRLEGHGVPPNRMAVLEFPSRQAALAFYEDPEYRPHLEDRLAGADCRFFLVTGEDVVSR